MGVNCEMQDLTPFLRDSAQPRVKHQVAVVTQQAIFQHLCVEPLLCLRNDVELRQVVDFVELDRLAAIAARGDW
jgi:hypothetical protein